MAEDFITIPELTETVEVDSPDFIIVRRGVTDRKINVENFTDSILVDASTVNKGIVQLSDSITSSSLSVAATANAVKKVNDAIQVVDTKANNALSGLSGKANTAHTHDASAITTGTLSEFRMTWATLTNHGAVRPTNNLGFSSSGGYVASIESVRTIQQSVNNLQQQIQDLELGTAFTPIPPTSYGGTSEREFPIGTTLLASGGPFIGNRNTRAYPYLATTSGFGASYIGQYSLSGDDTQISGKLNGIWVHRGSVGCVYNPVNKRITGLNNASGSGSEFALTINNAVLIQRVG